MQLSSSIQIMHDGTKICINTWLPPAPDTAQCVIVLVHGMCEHSLRYDKTATLFTEHGFIVRGYDQRGHGKTALLAQNEGTGMFGLLSTQDGFNKVVGDLDEIIKQTISDYPNKKIILFGHSFGSFVSIGYLQKAGVSIPIKKCVLCGTSGKMESLAKQGLALIAFMRLFHKIEYKSTFVRNVMFGRYLKRIPNAKTGLEWLSQNQANIDLYNGDKWCGGVATLGFYGDLLKGIIQVNKDDAIKKINGGLPVFFIAGQEDPVGNYGTGVSNLCTTYQQMGIAATIKLYDGLRHEILNETCGDKVVTDVIDWINSKDD